MNYSPKLDEVLKHISSVEMLSVLNIQTVLLQEMQNYMVRNGFKQLLLLMISPYENIVRRMDEKGTDKTMFVNYLEAAKRGLLPKSAGAGIGVERLLKFICGKRSLSKVFMFDRSVNSEFVF